MKTTALLIIALLFVGTAFAAPPCLCGPDCKCVSCDCGVAKCKAATPEASWYSAKVSVDFGGGKESHGSATPVIAEGGKTYLLTNAHVVEDATRPISVRCNGWWYSASYVHGSVVSYVTPTLINVDGPDLALVSINYEIDTVPLAEESPARGEAVWIHGFGGTLGKQPILRSGFSEPRFDLLKPTFISTIPSVQGDSGAGVFNSRGELVAVTWGGDYGPARSYAVPLQEVVTFTVKHPKLRKLFPHAAEFYDKRIAKKVAPKAKATEVTPAPKVKDAAPPAKAPEAPKAVAPVVAAPSGHWESVGLLGRRSVWVQDCPNGKCPAKK